MVELDGGPEDYPDEPEPVRKCSCGEDMEFKMGFWCKANCVRAALTAATQEVHEAKLILLDALTSLLDEGYREDGDIVPRIREWLSKQPPSASGAKGEG